MLIGVSYLVDFAGNKDAFWKVLQSSPRTLEQVLGDLEDDPTQASQWEQPGQHSPQWVQKRNTIFRYLFEEDAVSKMYIKSIWGIAESIREDALYTACMHGYIATVTYLFGIIPADTTVYTRLKKNADDSIPIWVDCYNVAVAAHQQVVADYLWQNVVNVRSQSLSGLLNAAIKTNDVKMFVTLTQQLNIPWDKRVEKYLEMVLEYKSYDILRFMCENAPATTSWTITHSYAVMVQIHALMLQDDLRFVMLFEQYFESLGPKDYVIHGGSMVLQRYSKYITPENAEKWLKDRVSVLGSRTIEGQYGKEHVAKLIEETILLMVSIMGGVTGLFLNADFHFAVIKTIVSRDVRIVSNVSAGDFYAILNNIIEEIDDDSVEEDKAMYTAFFTKLAESSDQKTQIVERIFEVLTDYYRYTYSNPSLLYTVILLLPILQEQLKEYVLGAEDHTFYRDRHTWNTLRYRFLEKFHPASKDEVGLYYRRVIDGADFVSLMKTFVEQNEVFERDIVMNMLVSLGSSPDGEKVAAFFATTELDTLSPADWSEIVDILLQKEITPALYELLINRTPPAYMDMEYIHPVSSFYRLCRDYDRSALYDEKLRKVLEYLMKHQVPFRKDNFLQDVKETQSYRAVAAENQMFILRNVAKYYPSTILTKNEWFTVLNWLSENRRRLLIGQDKGFESYVDETIEFIRNLIETYKKGAESLEKKKKIIKQELWAW